MYSNWTQLFLNESTEFCYFVFLGIRYICERYFAFFAKVIVLNGETGTGKTFNAWKALEFLTRSISSNACERQDVACGIMQKISNACRLISAFTTAPTVRNEISSRHVQLVWLEYKMGSICGATISSYLLERNRVTKGCCNFQIFGQVKEASCVLKSPTLLPILLLNFAKLYLRWWLR